jgi:hypothetical protein
MAPTAAKQLITHTHTRADKQAGDIKINIKKLHRISDEILVPYKPTN